MFSLTTPTLSKIIIPLFVKKLARNAGVNSFLTDGSSYSDSYVNNKSEIRDQTGYGSSLQMIDPHYATPKLLSEVRQIIDKLLPTLQDEYYRQVPVVSGIQEISAVAVQKLKTDGLEHWRQMVSCWPKLCDRALGKALFNDHRAFNIPLKWYLSANAFYISRFASCKPRVFGIKSDRYCQILSFITAICYADAVEVADLCFDDLNEQKIADIRDLAGNFKDTVLGALNRVTEVATQVQATTDAALSTIDRCNSYSSAATQDAIKSVERVQAVAAGTEELTASINGVIGQVGVTNQIVSSAHQTVALSSVAITKLSESVKKIGSILKVIDNIARQTNMLAMNATIEAARAGDAGRGFAIVAQEVKKLSRETASATGQIASLIHEVQSSTQTAADQNSKVTEVTASLRKVSEELAYSMNQQGIATEEIARSAQDAAAAMDSVTLQVDNLSDASVEQKMAVVGLTAVSTDLSDASDELRVALDKFLSHLSLAY